MERQELKGFTKFLFELGFILMVAMGLVTTYKIAEPIRKYNEIVAEISIEEMQQHYCPYCGHELEE